MNKNTILIVGLGNPGEQYVDTPHNAGFLVIDQLITNYPPAGNHPQGGKLLITSYPKLKSQIAETKIGGPKLILAKPQTFMNNSGEAVLALTKSYKLKAINSLWLIHDDIDLELGKIKIVRNRGSAGHKGVEDVMRKLKTKDFVRFRIGTRPKRLAIKRSKALMNKFVASPVSKAEQAALKKSITACKDAVLLAIEEGIEKAAGVYNAK